MVADRVSAQSAGMPESAGSRSSIASKGKPAIGQLGGTARRNPEFNGTSRQKGQVAHIGAPCATNWFRQYEMSRVPRPIPFALGSVPRRTQRSVCIERTRAIRAGIL